LAKKPLKDLGIERAKRSERVTPAAAAAAPTAATATPAATAAESGKQRHSRILTEAQSSIVRSGVKT